jgi:hypothetical protein
MNTVLRGRRAWWFYKVDGQRMLDPTHVREYESEDELRNVLAHPGLTLGAVRVSPMRFALLDLAIRVASRLRVLSHERAASLYARHPRLQRVRQVRIRVPGYYLIEANGTRLP